MSRPLRLRKLRLSLVTCALLAAILASRLPAQDPERVKEAIESAKASLKQSQHDKGHWERVTFGGDPTALCTLALLNAGEDPKGKHVQKALTYLRARKLHNTYEVSLEIMALCAADPGKDLDEIARRAKWLVDQQIKQGPYRGLWNYGTGEGDLTIRGNGDNSNGQFALLGLHEADRALKRFAKPSPVPADTWKWAMEYWAGAQNADGSWGYPHKGTFGYGSMTCAGIASLVIAAGQAQGTSAALAGETVKCCSAGGNVEIAQRIRDGLKWLERHKNFAANPQVGQSGYYYYMYALERVGRLTAQRFIGGSDWYREGIQQLMRRHARFRGWADGRGHGEEHEHVATSFALLFLSKGNRPNLIGKLKYAPVEGREVWNHHPSDAFMLTQFVEQKWQRDLSWQVIDAAVATADDYAHAPVLYLSGSQALPFLRDPDQRAKIGKALREYIDRGGFLYAEACCDNSAEFDRSFRELMKGPVFENIETNEFQDVRDDHEVWFYEGQDDKTRARMLALYGGLRSSGDGWLQEIRRGCRTAVIYCSRPPKPNDPNAVPPSCYWELQAGLGREGKLPAPIQANVNAALELGVNIVAYATGRKVKGKIDQLGDDNVKTPAASDRAILDIRQAIYDGTWNAAPGALAQLQRRLTRHAGIQVPTDRREIEILDAKLFDHHLIFLHGRNSFKFSDKQREQLRLYVERGGTILADAVCASKPFDDAFRAEMKAIFTKGPAMQAIPADHKLFTAEAGGFDLVNERVTLRLPPTVPTPGKPLRAIEEKTTPKLEGIRLADGRYGVIYSPYDLSCSLEGQKSAKCPGYESEDAAKIGVNVVLYSMAP